MLKGVARKHSKQQQHHSPSGCAFLRGKLQVRGADPVLVAKRKRSPGPRKLQPAPVLTQRPRTRSGKPTPQRCAHSDRNQTQKSHTLPAARDVQKTTRFSFGFPPLEALHRRGPPCSGNVFAAKSGPQSCPGQRAESRTFPNCKKLRYKHQPFSPLPAPRLNVANGNARKAS